MSQEMVSAQSFALVCDSGCDVPQSFCDIHKVVVVSFRTVKKSAQTQEVSPEELYDCLKKNNHAVEVVAPSKEEYIRVYQELLDAGFDHIISLHSSSNISASYNNAKEAADSLAHKAEIAVIDSKLASCGLGFIVADLAQMRNNNVSFEDAKNHALDLTELVKVYFIPLSKNAPAVKTAKSNGMFSRVHKVVENALGTLFLQTLDSDGKIVNVLSAVDHSNIAGKLARIMSRDALKKGDLTYIEMNSADEEVLQLLEKPLDTNEFEKYCIGRTQPKQEVVYYVGLGCIGLAYVPTKYLYDAKFVQTEVW